MFGFKTATESNDSPYSFKNIGIEYIGPNPVVSSVLMTLVQFFKPKHQIQNKW